jgi:hypothetical protein
MSSLTKRKRVDVKGPALRGLAPLWFLIERPWGQFLKPFVGFGCEFADIFNTLFTREINKKIFSGEFLDLGLFAVSNGATEQVNRADTFTGTV